MAARNFLFFMVVALLNGCALLPASAPVPVVERLPSESRVAERTPADAPRPPSPAIGASAAGPSRRAFTEPAVQTARSADALFMALSTLGIDYRRGGRSPASGFDCSGLVSHVYAQAFGLRVPPHTQTQSVLGTPVAMEALEPGDLVFFNTLKRPNSHVGIYIGDRRFVHAPKPGSAVRIENIGTAYWLTRFDGARRLLD